MSTLERAIAIAAEAHAGQTDKAGEPYILHPIRVMLRVTQPDDRIVAVLHDVLEDTAWTVARLREQGFSERILAALDSVTKREDDSDYFAFVRRAAAHPIGRRVKLADLADNLDLARIAKLTQRDVERHARYQHAVRLIQTLPEAME